MACACCHGLCVLAWSVRVAMGCVQWVVCDIMECALCNGLCVMVWSACVAMDCVCCH